MHACVSLCVSLWVAIRALTGQVGDECGLDSLRANWLFIGSWDKIYFQLDAASRRGNRCFGKAPKLISYIETADPYSNQVSMVPS